MVAVGAWHLLGRGEMPGWIDEAEEPGKLAQAIVKRSKKLVVDEQTRLLMEGMGNARKREAFQRWHSTNPE